MNSRVGELRSNEKGFGGGVMQMWQVSTRSQNTAIWSHRTHSSIFQSTPMPFALVNVEWLDGTISPTVRVPSDRPVDLWNALTSVNKAFARDCVFMLVVGVESGGVEGCTCTHAGCECGAEVASEAVWPWMYTHVTLRTGQQYIATLVFGCTSQAAQLQRLREGCSPVTWDWVDAMQPVHTEHQAEPHGEHGPSNCHMQCHAGHVRSFFAQVHRAAQSLPSVPIEWRSDLGFMTYLIDRNVVLVWDTWSRFAPHHVLLHIPLTLQALARDPCSVQQFPREVRDNVQVGEFRCAAQPVVYPAHVCRCARQHQNHAAGFASII